MSKGDLLALFREGGITKNDPFQPLKVEILKILENTQRDSFDVSVVPAALTNLWGSSFSRTEKVRAMVKPFRCRIWSRVRLNAGPAMAASNTQPEVFARVTDLMGRG